MFSIARALAQEARALVLDEPTTFLDLAHEMSLFELLHSLAHDGIAVLLVSHQLNLRRALCVARRIAASRESDRSPDRPMQ